MHWVLTPDLLPCDQLDQLEALERIKAAAAAAQVAVTATFADAADSEDVPTSARRTPPRAMSIGAEVALATLASPHAGEQRALLSRRLRDDLPRTLAALCRGELTEDRAFAVAREVAHLTAEQRRAVDDDLAPRLAGAGVLGDVRLRRTVRRACLRIASDAETRRYRRARADRRVTSRQLDDAAASARAEGDPRTAGQVRADTLAARVTGTDPATDTPQVKVHLVIGVESLFGDGTEPGLVPGVGLLPAALGTDLVRRAGAAASASLLRLFASPDRRTLVAMESAGRRFEGVLAEFLALRDGGLCRTPGCNAPIRHLDHIQSTADGGPTAAANGQGLCERCDYVKETPGWTSWVPDAGVHQPHEVHSVTEHLRITRSTSPPLPGGRAGGWDHSPAELRLASSYALIS